MAPGTDVRMNLAAFTPDQRQAIEARIAAHADYDTAEWTGLGIRQALRWRHDGQVYSCSGLIWTVLDTLGFGPGSIPGPDYWLTPDGQTFYEASCAIEDGLRARRAENGGSEQSPLGSA
jgi:hypothetical protein